MSEKPRSDLKPNTFDYENQALVTANGFREYDARWLFGKEINLLGVQALGLGFGTYLHETGVPAKVAVGHDYRSYSLSIKQALIVGLMNAGCEVHDIGLGLSRSTVRRLRWSPRATTKMAGPA
jgi:phosphomannomutase/phosphoglucomutase